MELGRYRFFGLAVLAACSGRPKTSATVPDSSQQIQPVKPRATDTFVIARPDGLFRLNKEGEVTAQLSTTPASGPRWVSENELVFWNPAGSELRFFDLANTEERVLAKLDTSCPALKKRLPLSVQSNAGAKVINTTRLCYSLLDKLEHKSSAWVRFQVELLTQDTSMEIVLPDACADLSGEQEDDLCSEHVESMVEEPIPEEALFHIRDGVLFKRDAQDDWRPMASDLLGLKPELHNSKWSTGGRWFVVVGGEKAGEIISRKWLLVDSMEGTVLPLGGDSPEWPAPLEVGQLTGQALAESVPYISAYEFPKWIGDDLLVGRTLYRIKDQRKIALSGDFAF